MQDSRKEWTMTQNQIAYQAHLENKRANEAREAETHRSNIANEQENKRYHTESMKETQRSNLAREAETNRSNVARETETNRSNLANEMLKATEINTRSQDTRYSADVGYQGRVDAAYINKWGVAKSDASSLASTIGKGVNKVAPGAVGVAQAAFGSGNALAARIATAPVRAVIDTAGQVKNQVNKVVQRSNSTRSKTNRTSNKPRNGGQRNVKTKKFSEQKY